MRLWECGQACLPNINDALMYDAILRTMPPCTEVFNDQSCIRKGTSHIVELGQSGRVGAWQTKEICPNCRTKAITSTNTKISRPDTKNHKM